MPNITTNHAITYTNTGDYDGNVMTMIKKMNIMMMMMMIIFHSRRNYVYFNHF